MFSIEKTIDDMLEKSGKSVAEVFDELPKMASAHSDGVLRKIRQLANQSSDAATNYAYSGQTHRFLEKAIATLSMLIFYNDAANELSSRQRCKRFADIESR